MSTGCLSKVTCSINVLPADFKLGQKGAEGQRGMVFLSLGPAMSYFTCLDKFFSLISERDLGRSGLRGWRL